MALSLGSSIRNFSVLVPGCGGLVLGTGETSVACSIGEFSAVLGATGKQKTQRWVWAVAPEQRRGCRRGLGQRHWVVQGLGNPAVVLGCSPEDTMASVSYVISEPVSKREHHIFKHWGSEKGPAKARNKRLPARAGAIPKSSGFSWILP